MSIVSLSRQVLSSSRLRARKSVARRVSDRPSPSPSRDPPHIHPSQDVPGAPACATSKRVPRSRHTRRQVTLCLLGLCRSCLSQLRCSHQWMLSNQSGDSEWCAGAVCVARRAFASRSCRRRRLWGPCVVAMDHHHPQLQHHMH